MFLFLLFSLFLLSKTETPCVCTTVPCPEPGYNAITMGNGGSTINYYYELHNSYPVVISAQGTVYNSSLSHGTETTSCTQKYSRILDDSGLENCDAGHILANHLGGYGNQPLNIFPQDPTVNRGSYASFEGEIYNCIVLAGKAEVSWKFYYETTEHTRPNQVFYQAIFPDSCDILNETFTN